MKIFNSIQLGKIAGAASMSASDTGASAPSCQNCAHFENDPALIEAAYRGLTAMSSGFASVRDRDGFCNYNQLYLSARDSCPHFASAGINK
jgi:hypothetical protein